MLLPIPPPHPQVTLHSAPIQALPTSKSAQNSQKIEILKIPKSPKPNFPFFSDFTFTKIVPAPFIPRSKIQNFARFIKKVKISSIYPPKKRKQFLQFLLVYCGLYTVWVLE